MRTFELKIDCDNDAFFIDHGEGGQESAMGFEIGRILRDLAYQLEAGDDSTRTYSLFDLNGNKVGSYTLTNE